jgi:hypothetical protein
MTTYTSAGSRHGPPSSSLHHKRRAKLVIVEFVVDRRKVILLRPRTNTLEEQPFSMMTIVNEKSIA